jgi:hypothetical protein
LGIFRDTSPECTLDSGGASSFVFTFEDFVGFEAFGANEAFGALEDFGAAAAIGTN